MMSPENDFNVNRVQNTQQIGGPAPIDKHQQKQRQRQMNQKPSEKHQQPADEQQDKNPCENDDQQHSIDYRA